METFTLINKDSSRIKVFETFEDVRKHFPAINSIMISYGCIFKRSSKPVIKGSRVAIIKAKIEEYKKLLKECSEKLLSTIIIFFIKKLI